MKHGSYVKHTLSPCKNRFIYLPMEARTTAGLVPKVRKIGQKYSSQEGFLDEAEFELQPSPSLAVSSSSPSSIIHQRPSSSSSLLLIALTATSWISIMCQHDTNESTYSPFFPSESPWIICLIYKWSLKLQDARYLAQGHRTGKQWREKFKSIWLQSSGRHLLFYSLA